LGGKAGIVDTAYAGLASDNYDNLRGSYIDVILRKQFEDDLEIS
jgi:hypothetical protein